MIFHDHDIHPLWANYGHIPCIFPWIFRHWVPLTNSCRTSWLAAHHFELHTLTKRGRSTTAGIGWRMWKMNIGWSEFLLMNILMNIDEYLTWMIVDVCCWWLGTFSIHDPTANKEKMTRKRSTAFLLEKQPTSKYYEEKVEKNRPRLCQICRICTRHFRFQQFQLLQLAVTWRVEIRPGRWNGRWHQSSEVWSWQKKDETSSSFFERFTEWKGWKGSLKRCKIWNK